jgi:hypothetical protein
MTGPTQAVIAFAGNVITFKDDVLRLEYSLGQFSIINVTDWVIIDPWKIVSAMNDLNFQITYAPGPG